ncbi:FAD binding domain-containing protein [Nonomuraea maheshkhaliensis]|uniref:FAD binding domain-containing protein n=1 Tax=Nonomuraea maheshkhaliensis TaxID=419590 RepID=A0ABN2HN73_9ACTN
MNLLTEPGPVPPSTTSLRAESQPSIAIIGGSITGPTLALLLHQAGFTRVSVLEASPSPFAQAGGVIGLDHASLATLETLGIPQAELAPFPSERVTTIRIADRKETGRVHSVYPGRNTAWHVLNSALLNRLPDTWLRTGNRVRSMSIAGNGQALLNLADRTSITADLVVFADGRRSIGRRLLDPTRPLHYAGYVAWRGQLTGNRVGIQDYTRLGAHGGAFHMFPIPRKNGDTGLDWTFYLNMSSEEFSRLLGGDPTQRTFIQPHHVPPMASEEVISWAYQLFPEAVAETISATTDWYATPILDIDPPQRMVHSLGAAHALLLADALAPVRPNTAQGANNGIEQDRALAIALGQHLHHGADLNAALDHWQQRLLPSVHRALQEGPKLSAALGLGRPLADPVPA